MNEQMNEILSALPGWRLDHGVVRGELSRVRLSGDDRISIPYGLLAPGEPVPAIGEVDYVVAFADGRKEEAMCAEKIEQWFGVNAPEITVSVSATPRRGYVACRLREDDCYVEAKGDDHLVFPFVDDLVEKLYAAGFLSADAHKVVEFWVKFSEKKAKA